MWSELALHFLGTVTNPVIVALPALLLLATSAVAGVVAAEVVLAIVLPLGMLALSGVLWWRGRGRPGSDGRP